MIVVAAIAERDGRILLCQRKPGAAHALKWEFPGGKVEPGETPGQALERELKEELNLKTHTGRLFATYTHEDAGLQICFYYTHILGGTPELIDCNAIAWVAPAGLLEYDLTPGDAYAASLLAQERAARHLEH